MKKEYLILIIALMFGMMINIVSAESITPAKVGEDKELFQTCNNCTYCNFTSIKINGIEILTNVETIQRVTYYYYNLSKGNLTESGSGEYCYDCGNSVDVDTGCINFPITPSGRDAPTEGEGIIYISTLLAMTLFCIFFFILSYQFKPSKDAEMNEDGSYNPIPNDKPALRFGCLALSFIMAFMILFYAMVSTQTTLSGFEKIEDSFYIFMWVVGFIFVIIFIFILITLLIQAVDSLRSKRGLQNV